MFSRTAVASMVGVSFDALGTLIRFKGGQSPAALYRTCLTEVLAMPAHSGPTNIPLPTTAALDSAFRTAYRSVLSARRAEVERQYPTDLSARPLVDTHLSSESVTIPHVQALHVPIGGFSAAAAAEDWEAVVRMTLHEACGPSLPAALLAQATGRVLALFEGSAPYEVIPDTILALWRLANDAEDVHIACVSNMDDRLLRVLEELALTAADFAPTDGTPARKPEGIAILGETAPSPAASHFDPLGVGAAEAEAAAAAMQIPLASFFDVIVTPPAVGAAKPHPAPIVAAMLSACPDAALPASSGGSKRIWSDALGRLSADGPLAAGSVTLPDVIDAWVHVGDHADDAAAAAAIPRCRFVSVHSDCGTSLYERIQQALNESL